MGEFFDFTDKEFRSAFVEESAIADIQYEICRVMKEKNITRAELARRLDVSAPHVTQMLSDEDANLTIKTIARVFDALGVTPLIKAVDPHGDVKGCVDAGDTYEEYYRCRPQVYDAWFMTASSDMPVRIQGQSARTVVWLDAYRAKAA